MNEEQRNQKEINKQRITELLNDAGRMKKTYIEAMFTMIFDELPVSIQNDYINMLDRDLMERKLKEDLTKPLRGSEE